MAYPSDDDQPRRGQADQALVSEIGNAVAGGTLRQVRNLLPYGNGRSDPCDKLNELVKLACIAWILARTEKLFRLG